ncbi:MAG: Glu/Leu/Phe/Val dehydrogenase dimerization domain-containing protein [Planctomycetaceae bacterium]
MQVDVRKLSAGELERLTRRFVDEIHDIIGPDKDIPAPDMGTNAQVMAWIMNQYQKYHGFNPACVTGKPVELHGAEGREEATGRGVGLLTTTLLEKLKMNVQGARIVLQGFGNVGTFTARYLHDQGADHCGFGCFWWHSQRGRTGYSLPAGIRGHPGDREGVSGKRADLE